MDRQEVLRKLFKIKQCYEVDITEQLDLLGKDDKVPEDVKKFVSSYEYKVEDFMEALKGKEFYKSLKNPKNKFTRLKGLSSMLTHSIIEIEQNEKHKSFIAESLQLERVIEALRSYLVLDDVSCAEEMVDELKEVINVKVGEK